MNQRIIAMSFLTEMAAEKRQRTVLVYRSQSSRSGSRLIYRGGESTVASLL